MNYTLIRSILTPHSMATCMLKYFIVVPLLLAATAYVTEGPFQKVKNLRSSTAFPMQPDASEKPRVIVLTDISSLSQQEGEPDDGQSLIRLMLYTNDLDIEGLIASSNLGHGQVVKPELIRQVVQTYGKVRSNLLLHDKEYPPAAELEKVIKAGQPVALPKLPVENSIGDGKDTEGSAWIIHVVDKRDARPVWVTIWGGSADLAQALWKVRQTRSAAEVARFVSKLRIHSVYDQDQTGQWIKEQFPELFYITRNHGIRGMYRGGDTALVRSGWVEENIKNNHGPLGALYVNYKGGDIWGRSLGRVTGIKEGDTPSFLSLIPNGLNNPDYPEWGGWGGRFAPDGGNPKRYVDATDSVENYQTDPDIRIAAVYRWRPDWQADFASRLDWCVKPYKDANHAPVAKIKGTALRNVLSGKEVVLSAAGSSDPDGNKLSYQWMVYTDAGSYPDKLELVNAQAQEASFTAPQVNSSQTIHVILNVTDNGSPALTSYKRVLVTVSPTVNR